jgi:hypothetical protein
MEAGHNTFQVVLASWSSGRDSRLEARLLRNLGTGKRPRLAIRSSLKQQPSSAGDKPGCLSKARDPAQIPRLKTSWAGTRAVWGCTPAGSSRCLDTLLRPVTTTRCWWGMQGVPDGLSLDVPLSRNAGSMLTRPGQSHTVCGTVPAPHGPSLMATLPFPRRGQWTELKCVFGVCGFGFLPLGKPRSGASKSYWPRKPGIPVGWGHVEGSPRIK